MSDLPRPAREATEALRDHLRSDEHVVAAVEGQRMMPGRVWMGLLLVGFIAINLSVSGLLATALAAIPVAAVSYVIAHVIGTRVPAGELAGFGFTLAVTDASYYVRSHGGFKTQPEIHGPFTRPSVKITVKRRTLSSHIAASGAFSLRLRVASGAALNGFNDAVEAL